MVTSTGDHASTPVDRILSRLAQKEWLIGDLDWPTFMAVEPPYPATGFFRREVTAGYHHNDYDWDIHGSVYTPFRNALPGHAFVLIHGGGVNELDFHETPDGRPGLASVLAAQGFEVLTPSYPGLWPPGGRWTVPVTQRKPCYLLDQGLGDEEINDRLLKATYQVYMHGIGLLVEKCLGRRKLFAHGHSTGGPMAADLHKYLTTATVTGILGWGSGGPDGWILRWRQEHLPPQASHAARSLTEINYRTVDEYRSRLGYEDFPDLTPWGRLEQRFELTSDTTPTFNPPLQNVSHLGPVEQLDAYQRATGLPREEYVGHLGEPDPAFLETVKVLLLVGENDLNHWKAGGQRPEERQDGYVAKRYADRTRGAHLIVVPRYTHMGHWALHNEKLAYLWLWAVRSGHFGDLG
jgi:hypothetical protein